MTDIAVTNDKHWIINHLDLAFVMAVLSPVLDSDMTVPGNYVAVIRSVVLRNVLRGRLARIAYRQSATMTDEWLAGYIQQVEHFYRADRDAWMEFQTPAGQEKLYNLLFTFACGHVKALRLGAYHIEARDVASEAWCACAGRLHNYPFDLALRAWLDRHVKQHALNLHHLCPRQFGLVSLADMRDEDLPDSTATRDARKLDAMIDLLAVLPNLTKLNQRVLSMWYQGFSLNESSQRLNLTRKAVANRRNRIQNQIRSKLG